MKHSGWKKGIMLIGNFSWRVGGLLSAFPTNSYNFDITKEVMIYDKFNSMA